MCQILERFLDRISVRKAAFQDPGNKKFRSITSAGPTVDDLPDLLRIKSQPHRKRQKLGNASHIDIVGGIIDHLSRLAAARSPHVKHRCPDHVQIRFHLVKGLLQAADHDGQCSSVRTCLHAGNRRVQEGTHAFFEGGSDHACAVRRGGAGIDHNGTAFLQHVDQAALSERHFLHDPVIWKAQENDAAVSHLRVGRHDRKAFLGKAFFFFFRSSANRKAAVFLQQIAGHPQSHCS